MRWNFVLPGQPLSWNAAYRIAKKTGKRGSFLSLIKTDAAERYQRDAILIIRSAKPSGWKPVDQVVVRYWMFLARDMDCDNVMKLVHDAIAKALGIDDAIFLPRVEEKSKGWGSKARISVELEDHVSPSVDRRGSSTIPPVSSSSSPASPPTPSSS